MNYRGHESFGLSEPTETESPFVEQYKKIEGLLSELGKWQLTRGNEILREEEMDQLVDLAIEIIDSDPNLEHVLADKKLFQTWKKLANILYKGIDSNIEAGVSEKVSSALVKILKVADPKTNKGPADNVMQNLFDRWPWSDLKFKPIQTKKSDTNEAVLKKYFDQFGLDAETAFKVWYASQPKVSAFGQLPGVMDNRFNHPVNTALENIKEMRRLELQHPGGVKTLVDKFGVYCFCRYEKGVLDDQLEQVDDTAKPYGVLIGGVSDHNSSAYRNVSINTNASLWKQCKELGINLRVVEANNQRELRKRFFFLEEKYNLPRNEKAVFGVINGHSNKNLFALGKREMPLEEITTENLLSGNFVADSKRFFADGSYFVVNGCLAGEKDGIAEQGSKAMPHLHVLACPEEISEIYYRLSKSDESNVPNFSVDYKTGYFFKKEMTHYKGDV
ncbi:MAG: hypothetical protein WA057_02580 [Candidatus Magasanikiibacteriota bacterium]